MQCLNVKRRSIHLVYAEGIVAIDHAQGILQTLCGNALTYRTDDGNWITVSEWSMIGDGKVNRRDYEFSYLVGDSAEQDLFSDVPCATFPPVYFLNRNAAAYGEE